jgi:hypothetical protein
MIFRIFIVVFIYTWTTSEIVSHEGTHSGIIYFLQKSTLVIKVDSKPDFRVLAFDLTHIAGSLIRVVDVHILYCAFEFKLIKKEINKKVFS